MEIELNEDEVIGVVNKVLDRADQAATSGQRFWAKYGLQLEEYLELNGNPAPKSWNHQRDRNCSQIRKLKDALTFAALGLSVAGQLRRLFLLAEVLKEINEESSSFNSDPTIKDICIGPFPKDGWRSPDIKDYQARELEFIRVLR